MTGGDAANRAASGRVRRERPRFGGRPGRSEYSRTEDDGPAERERIKRSRNARAGAVLAAGGRAPRARGASGGGDRGGAHGLRGIAGDGARVRAGSEGRVRGRMGRIVRSARSPRRRATTSTILWLPRNGVTSWRRVDRGCARGRAPGDDARTHRGVHRSDAFAKTPRRCSRVRVRGAPGAARAEGRAAGRTKAQEKHRGVPPREPSANLNPENATGYGGDDRMGKQLGYVFQVMA